MAGQFSLSIIARGEDPPRYGAEKHTGKPYPGGSQLHWRQLSTMIREYLNHPESKFENDDKLGRMKRRHLHVAQGQIGYIGKEVNEIEETEVLGLPEDSYVSYTPMTGLR